MTPEDRKAQSKVVHTDARQRAEDHLTRAILALAPIDAPWSQEASEDAQKALDRIQ